MGLKIEILDEHKQTRRVTHDKALRALVHLFEVLLLHEKHDAAHKVNAIYDRLRVVSVE